MSDQVANMVRTEFATKGDVITVDIADTNFSDSAIAANGSSIFKIIVVDPARQYVSDVETIDMPGTGKVVSPGPVNGHEIGFLPSSIVFDR